MARQALPQAELVLLIFIITFEWQWRNDKTKTALFTLNFQQQTGSSSRQLETTNRLPADTLRCFSGQNIWFLYKKNFEIFVIASGCE